MHWRVGHVTALAGITSFKGGGPVRAVGGGVGHGLGARTGALKTLLFMAGAGIQVK